MNNERKMAQRDRNRTLKGSHQEGRNPLFRALTRSQVRRVDRVAIERFGMSGLVLMENAGREAAREIADRYPNANACILCGKGNNAGDGYVIARHLQFAQATSGGVSGSVRIISLVDTTELAGDAAVNHCIAQLAGIPIATVAIEQLSGAVGSPDLIVDCLLGTGAEGDPREPFATAIRLANAATASRVAIDLPSGLDCDSGFTADPTLRADLTLTFVAPKVGFAAQSARLVLGEVVVLPIGVPLRLLNEHI
jgi:NAD(P)H-hydrate epimerase